MAFNKITENVYAITDGSTRGNVCAFVLPTQIVFIDSGMNLPVIKKFREDLEKETGRKTSTLIITHAHGDHVFGNQIFKDCQIIASKETKLRMISSKDTDWTPEKLKERIAAAEDPNSLMGLEIVLPMKTFENSYEIIDFSKKLFCKNTGGHTAGSVYVYYPDEKAIAVGDNLFNGMFPWGGDQTANPEAWVNALKEILLYDVDLIIPGHGPICGKEGAQEFKTYLEKVIILIRKMSTERNSEEKIISAVNAIEYHPPKVEQWKNMSLKKWYLELTKKQ